MSKIPVGATIAHAYRFAFGNFSKILGIIWLPWLILSVGGFLLLRPSMALSTATATRDTAQIGSALALLLPFYVVVFVLLCMQVVGITQEALSLRQGSPYYYFNFGKPLWLLIGAILLIVGLMVGGYVVLVLIIGLLAALVKFAHLSGLLAAILGIAGVLGFVGAFCAYIYALVRLTFLLTPVIVAEHQLGLKRSWTLARANFWRIFAILLSILVPAIALESIFMFGFLFHGLPPSMPLNATPDQAAVARAAITAWNARTAARMTDYWYIIYPLFALFTVLFYGLSAGTQAFAYRSLTELENSTPVAGG